MQPEVQQQEGAPRCGVDVRFGGVLRGCPLRGKHTFTSFWLITTGVNGGAGAAVATLPVRVSRVRCLSQHPWELRSSLAGFPAFPTDGAAMPPKAKGVRGAEVPGRFPAPCAFPRGLPLELEWVLFSPQRSAQISLASVFVPTSPTASGWQDPACRAPTCPAHSV